MKPLLQKSRQLFSNVYILGGSPCSGKSTLAERLKLEYEFQYYKVDDHEQDHLKRSTQKHHPTMYQYSTMGWDEIWMRPVKVLVEEALDFYRERFEMIVQDLEQINPQRPILLEGAAYLPELVKKAEVNPDRVLFLVPTKDFQLEHYSRRPWIKDILNKCNDPEQAFDNWMKRDQLFGKVVLEQAQKMGFKTILVDGDSSADQLYKLVKEHFGLP